jgi:hypothetical protein
MSKGVRMGTSAIVKVFSKTIRGQLSPEVGEALIKELGDTVAVASEQRTMAVKSRKERLRRKQEPAK